MGVCTDIADYHWLTGGEAAKLLQDLAHDGTPLHTTVARLRRSLSATRTHLLIEQVELRRRAAVKFTAADRMFFTRTALEQATDEHVARYKATRLRAIDPMGASDTVRAAKTERVACTVPAVVADLCCGIGGDLLALAKLGAVIGVDLDPVVTHLAATNIQVTNFQAAVRFDNADAAAFDLDQVAAWHIDPNRRLAGRRTISLDACQPNRVALERLLTRCPHAAMKLAPATQVPVDWAARSELEWISRGGECRQLVAWHGDLAHTLGQHRATILSVTGNQSAPRSLVGVPHLPLSVALRPRAYVFDVDSAVLAAGLQGALAAEHELAALTAAGPTYLTGDVSLDDPAVASFRVDDVVPLRSNILATYFLQRSIGRLEIKKRGVDVDPEKLRNELKLRGDNASTLLITPVDGRPAAIIAQRMSGSGI